MQDNFETRNGWTREFGILLVFLSAASYFFIERPWRSYNILSEKLFESTQLSVVVSYGLMLLFCLVMLINNFVKNGIRLKRIQESHFIIFLLLLSITAFSLNRESKVYTDFTLQLQIYLILGHIGLAVFVFRKSILESTKPLLLFLVGLGTPIALFFTIMIAPFTAIGLMYIFFPPISLLALLTFAPGLIFIMLIVGSVRMIRKREEFLTYSIGFVIPLLISGFFFYDKIIHFVPFGC
ncbi:MAG: hypothetical protein IIA45_01735 [Bacteroidetes bacterium]|nr:hypothetical protein [Bacteroidota bacterium]